MELKNMVALVTGASQGIGKETAVCLAREGASVVLSARNEIKLNETAKIIDSFGGSCMVSAADISNESDVKKLFKDTKDKFGRLDILINNAGILVKGRIIDFKLEDFDKIINTNVRGTFMCCKEALKIMAPLKKGFIINISSVVGFKGYLEQGPYAASKHAVNGLTKTLAAEAQEDGINVALVSPGGVDTELCYYARPDIDKTKLIPPKDIAETILFMLKLSENSWVDEIYVRRRTSKPFI